MSVLVTFGLLLLTIILLGFVIFQVRLQREATETLISDHRVRTRLFEDAEESTTVILSRTIKNIGDGTPDPNLKDDSFSLQVIRELVKRKVPKEKWIELQTNERLVHELFLLMRSI